MSDLLQTETTATDIAPRDRVHLFGVTIDRVDRLGAARQVLAWAESPESRCRVVVTPNLNHLRLLQRHDSFRAAYDAADFVTADGMPIVWASRLLGKRLPERVTGADLVTDLFDLTQAASPTRVFFLGAGPGVAERAAEETMRRWSGVVVSGTYSPPFGFENDPQENEAILDRIAFAAPQVLVVGLGAPKQECWVHRYRDRIDARVALCVGATIDFLAGNVARAPEWMQRRGLEWLYRITCEPRRLASRYLHDACTFPPLLLREAFAGSRAGS